MGTAPLSTDTIVAVATPPGEGGIGIVRLSGPDALAVGRRLFSFAKEPREIEPYRLYVGDVVLPEEGPGDLVAIEGRQDTRRAEWPASLRSGMVDRALFVLMRSPHSYTGQDVVEIHCHGSPLLLNAVMIAAIAGGARPAERGEFTRRAFLNGKIDLVQAEAVADLIAAKTIEGLSVFSRHLAGGLSGRLMDIRERLLDLLSEVEATVDFSDQDIDTLDMESVAEKIKASLDSVKELLDSYRAGRIYREGGRLVIAGRPNVGKSSLMNRLLGRSRAIVAPEPGTTTDTIEDVTDVRGIPVRIVDTCGLREARGIVEREGVSRTRDALGTADAVLVVAEAPLGVGHEERDVIEQVAASGRPVILVMNKVDLVSEGASAPADVSPTVVFTSALTGAGINDLREAIASLMTGSSNGGRTEDIITNARHFAALHSVSRCLEEALSGAVRDISPEFIALDLREGLSALGEVTGQVTTDEILDTIFSRFCIGK